MNILNKRVMKLEASRPGEPTLLTFAWLCEEDALHEVIGLTGESIIRRDGETQVTFLQRAEAEAVATADAAGLGAGAHYLWAQTSGEQSWAH